MIISCPKCQTENPGTAKFCLDCGTVLIGIAASPEARPEVTETLQTPVHELASGTTFAGRYRIIEELGHGGMGRVYKVQDTKVGEKVALKLIRPEAGLDKHSAERFTNELKLARKIRHKNVCQMFDLGEAAGTRYITMEYVHGEDLKQIIRKMGRLSPSQAVGIAVQVCDGLAEAHKLGVVHRDLKPQNIMLDEDGNARIMDFGIARSLSEKGITGGAVMIGTPEYMSPEQVEGKEVDPRSDIYSLGIILYEMATGRVPFEGETPFAIGVKQKSEAPRAPRTLNADVPESLSQVILRCLEKDREKRYASAGDLRAELDKIGPGVPASAKAVPVQKTAASREITVKLTPRKLVLPAAALIVLIAAGLILLLQPRGPRLNPKRIVVIPFDNKTGDPKLESLGFMTGDWITQGLMKIEGIAVSSVPDAGALADISNEKDKIAIVAGGTQAGKVVTGAYYLEGETLRFVAQIHDAVKEKLLSALDPVSGPAQEPLKIIELLRQRVMAALALSLETKFPAILFDQKIPNYTAYQAYAEGTKAFVRQDFEKAIELYEQSCQADPEFIAPLLGLSYSYYNLGDNARSDEATRKVEAFKDRLSPWQAILLEGRKAVLRGDQIARYQIDKRGYQLDPNATIAYSLGWSAVRINRPGDAVAVFKTVDPASPFVKDWLPYWNFYSFAHHMRGDHKKEVAVARRAQKFYPDKHSPLIYEIRAQAALGRTAKIERLIKKSQTLPPEPDRDPRFYYFEAGRELRAHGYRKESLDYMERALAWLRNRPDSEKKASAFRRSLAYCLYWAEKWEEAKAEFESLSGEAPDNLNYRSLLGCIAVKLGNREKAQEIFDELGKVERPYLFGAIPYFQGCIAALLGEKDEAVKLLIESVAKGLTFGPASWLHLHLALEPLADYPPFQEFIKPKG